MEYTYKRIDVIDWDEYFMGIACVAAKRSKDPILQTGACIVHEDNRVLGIGYNGMSVGIPDSEHWQQGTYDAYVCNAIKNAFAYATVESVRGARIYTTVFPSNGNVKHMIQTGIVEVIYLSEKPYRGPILPETDHMLTVAKIERNKFEPSKSSIVIDFEDMERKANELL